MCVMLNMNPMSNRAYLLRPTDHEVYEAKRLTLPRADVPS